MGRRDRAAPGEGHGDGDARPAGRGVHLQRRGAGVAGRRAARRGAAGPDVGTLRAHRARPRQVPGPDPVVGRRSPFGFSSSPDTWLPMPQDWAALTVERQIADPESTFSFFQRVIKLRKERTEFEGDEIDWLDAPRDALIFRAAAAGGVRGERGPPTDPAAAGRPHRGQRPAGRRRTPAGRRGLARLNGRPKAAAVQPLSDGDRPIVGVAPRHRYPAGVLSCHGRDRNRDSGSEADAVRPQRRKAGWWITPCDGW